MGSSKKIFRPSASVLPFSAFPRRIASYSSSERLICLRLTSGMISTRTTTTIAVHIANPSVHSRSASSPAGSAGADALSR